jgi:quercetin dioxygenase-like cupin family protein
MPQPFVISREGIDSQVSETFQDPQCGSGLTWKTLTSASKTQTDTFTTGIATCAAGDSALCPHQHKHAEIYYITKGEGVVDIDGTEHVAKAGSVVFIPSDACHGVRNLSSSEELEWFYVFAADDFGEVKYRFAHDTKAG